MIRSTSRGAVYLVVSGAAAAALLGIAAGIVTTIARSAGATRIPLILLAVAALALVIGLLGARRVRAAEIAFANLFLGSGLDELGESRDRRARVDAAVWALISMGIGASALFLLLFLVPAGATLMAAPVIREPLTVAGHDYRLSAAQAWLMVPAGLALVVLAAAAQVAGVGLLQRWAPIWLRPTDADRLVSEQRRADRLARANALARDLHDSIGHALTAIGMQAEAGVATGAGDPDRSVQGFAQIRDVAHAAVAELDRVLGVLREPDETANPDGSQLADLSELVDRFPPGTVQLVTQGDPSAVADDTSRAAFRIVQEAVTNGLRHGTPPVRVEVRVSDEVRLQIVNEMAASTSRPPGRGISGMRERAMLAGGRLDVDPRDGRWTVDAVLPRGER